MAVSISGDGTLTGVSTGKPVAIKTFTTDGTYTVPSGVSTIKVYVTGGGGGGGSHNTDDAQGGGGAGGTAIKLYTVTPNQQFSYSIGTGGTASSGNTNSSGTGGGASYFNSTLIGYGGNRPTGWAVGGRGGNASGGDLNLYGDDGHTGNIDGQGSEESGGNGGSSYWGGAGTGGSHWASRDTSRGWGCGGSGTHASTNNTGTDGVQGVVVIEEYS
jgi:hypothetical protein